MEVLALLQKEARLASSRQFDSSRMEEESPLRDFLLKNKMRMVLWMPCAHLHCHIQTYCGYFSHSNACFGVDVG